MVVKIVLNGVSRLRKVRVRSSQSCNRWMKRKFVKNCCLSPVGSVRLTGFSFMSDLNLICKLHHLFHDKWLTLETKHTCSLRCLFRLSGILDSTVFACLHSCLCLIFAAIRAKSAPGTRTKFNYFWGDLTDAATAT